MKIACIADLHGTLLNPSELYGCDLVLIAGDVCCHGSADKQLKWLNTSFRSWLSLINTPVIACAGNHDWAMYKNFHIVNALNLPWTLLQDSSVVFSGIHIYGTPWSLEFMNWAFNLSENQLADKWSMIPDNTDILLCHSPPKYYGDLTVDGHVVGSASLLQRIKEIKPKLVVFGHIHEGYGQWTISNVNTSDTTLMNASILTERYTLKNKPMFYEI